MEDNAFLRVHVWINKFKKYLLSLGRFVVNILIYLVSMPRAVAALQPYSMRPVPFGPC